ncbi:peptidase alpha-lytic pro domain-containing protein [Amycolatopsis orientalis]|uniref:Peptidase alpha-lytic pro domain-containing protein n=1 Tax=Amycolatopsis orientalis TaxID=31958 RepID=A0A193CBK8_AMYOR|nr:S1 family peptidase [Amycolatopsis orientalis]ANN21862.1 peptidase alpha-lytic pro domain-containing protein [Amycolatopsis orientalis]
MIRRPLRIMTALAGAAAAVTAFAVPASAAAPALNEAAGPAALAAAREHFGGSLGAAFAGSWLDTTTGALVVGTTDASGSARIRAAGAVPKVVRHNLAELKRIQSILDGKTGGLPASVAGWYVDLPTNEVVVSVVGGDPAGRAWAAAAGVPVRVDQVKSAPRPLWAVVGGQGLYFNGGACSVGFNAYDDDDHYVITAGHCTELGGTVRGVGGTIGTVARSSFPGNDYGTVRVTHSDVSTPPRVDRYGDGSDVRIEGADVVGVGGRICRSGITTHWQCGRVEALDQTVNYGNGNIVKGLTQTDACAEPGDSGGSFVSRPTSGSGTKLVQAQGMTSGGSGDCEDGGTTFFQPVKEVLNRYDLTLEKD